MRSLRVSDVRLDGPLICRAVTYLTLAFGYLLLIGGLCIMVLSPSAAQTGLSNFVSNSIVSFVNQVPGMPVNLSSIMSGGDTLIGLFSWITGVIILVVGMGLQIKNRFAKSIGLIIFALALVLDFVAFLVSGILGATDAFTGIFTNAFFLYLFSKMNVKRKIEIA